MNRVLYASDCLNILQDRDALPDGSVDLIYLDPPFNSNSKYNLPFKGKDKTILPVEAFNDTWHWTEENQAQFEDMEADLFTRHIADVIRFAQQIERGTASLSSYLLNMAVRLLAMKRILKETGSIYLHCDPTASHYLKLLMDAVFGSRNFRNEIVWAYRGREMHITTKFNSKHDIILFYSNSQKAKVCMDAVSLPYDRETKIKDLRRKVYKDESGREWVWETRGQSKGQKPYKRYIDEIISKGKALSDVWADLQFLRGNHPERLGYPTQKPVALLERIIKASCPPGGIVLDPFCGCGTTIHAAEALRRQWIGIDISSFATGLVRKRMLDNFPNLTGEIEMRGEIPLSISDARDLAHRDKFEFEKWVCGQIGAEGLFHNPGTRGADGGVDGVLKFYRIRPNKKMKPEYAIVQVKGGHVTADSVRALRTTIDRFDATAGVMVCFDQFMGTVENQRGRETFRDALGIYPVIQGHSVENLLADAPLNLPLYGRGRRGVNLHL